MKSFHQIFNELKKDRGLSNKQIASFTGVKLKEVKQWEAGTSFPIETKVVDALEGLLGTCLLYTSPSPRDPWKSRMPSSA